MKIIRRFLFIVFVAAVLAVVLYGCATVPETGRSQLILVDAGQVAQMSLTEFEKIKQSTPISKNAEENAQVKRVGLRIAAVAPVPNAKWEFVVFDKPDVLNAFALPGGKVGVYSGLFKITQSDAGLATVLAHEIGHVVARHGAERVSEGLLVQLGGAVLAEATKTRPDATQQVIQAAYGIGSNIGLVLPHSRQQESEADHLGLIYMARAGYDPHEAVEFWKRFSAYNKQHGGGRPLEFLSTHPLDERRIAQIQELLPQVLPDYQKAKR
jgi:predicted Zn-dependent protease